MRRLPPRRLTPAQARVGVWLLGALAVLALVLVSLPPWSDNLMTWIAVPLVLGVVGLGLWVQPPWRRRATRNYPPTGIHAAPRRWIIGLTCVVVIAGYVLTGWLGHDVVAARMLPEQPGQATATRLYRPCPSRSCGPRLVFEADGREVDAAYARGPVVRNNSRVGDAFVYDPADPTHVMPRAEFDYGRGAGLPTVLALIAGMTLWCAAVAATARRRGRIARNALRENRIAATEWTKRRDRLLVFHDGTRLSYVQTRELQDLIDEQLPDRRR